MERPVHGKKYFAKNMAEAEFEFETWLKLGRIKKLPGDFPAGSNFNTSQSIFEGYTSTFLLSSLPHFL